MNFPEFSEKGEVICQECGQGFKVLTGTHTRKHGMSIEDYRVKYPGAPTSGKMFSLTMSQTKLKSQTFKEKPEPIVEDSSGEDDLITDEVLDDEDAPTIEEIQESIKDEDMTDLFKGDEKREMEYDPTEVDTQTPRDKLSLLKFLRTKYPFIQNNYMIRKFTLTNFLEFEFVTDMADPINKIDFEFPNAFWHNRMPFEDPQRNIKLRREGWKVITIDSRVPKTKHLEELISK